MKKYTQQFIDDMLEKHKKWLNDEEGGEKADLSYADLRLTNLSSADLRSADLRFTDLSYADLRFTNLSSADLSSADLRYANLRSANLSSADLSSANLSYANLRYANLSYANLSSANLSSADLSSAISDLKFISFTCIGSRKGMTTYCFNNDTVWCGCFEGTLQEFEEKVKKTHKNNKQYLKEYIGAINYIKFLKEV